MVKSLGLPVVHEVGQALPRPAFLQPGASRNSRRVVLPQGLFYLPHELRWKKSTSNVLRVEGGGGGGRESANSEAFVPFWVIHNSLDIAGVGAVVRLAQDAPWPPPRDKATLHTSPAEFLMCVIELQIQLEHRTKNNSE